MKSRVCYGTFTFLVLVTKVSVGVERYWLPDLEWQTAENWMDNRVPLVNSHVVFPLDTNHAVGMASFGNFKFTGIELARTGSLILPRNGNIQLSDSGKSPTRVSRWVKEGHFSWTNPDNWNGTSKAAPHLEQVPCRQDDIVLPEKSRAFSIHLPMREIEVRSIRTSDEKQPFVSWQWDDMENKRVFDKGIFTVKYAEYSCEKCSCQNDPSGDYLEEICAVQRQKCGFIPCEYPMKVEGHCCRYCGGRVSLSNKASLPMVRTAANEAMEGYTERIAWHVRRTWDGAAEVLIKGKDDYSEIDILKAVDDIKENLLSMKIEVLSTETAGSGLRDHRLTVALVPLFGTPFAILFLLFLGFLYFGYSFRYILANCREIFSSIRDEIRVDQAQVGKPFGFARFENISEGNVQIANVAGSSEQKPVNDEARTKEPSGGRFENLLYRSKRRPKEGEVLDMDAPLSLAMLRDKVDDAEEVEVDIDQ
ncbi:protein amnionless [Ptiloglossa arizonensis]|uniref:protein amnionless n=1 Tax=Ptiloglossa arizonensis TaxID=3350558 RepID=UPI003FA06358